MKPFESEFDETFRILIRICSMEPPRERNQRFCSILKRNQRFLNLSCIDEGGFEINEFGPCSSEGGVFALELDR